MSKKFLFKIHNLAQNKELGAVPIHVVPSPPRLPSSNKDITPLDTHIILHEGSITRTQARQFTLQVSSFLSTPFRDYNNRLLSNDIIF
jgi:hypothetical protein